MTDSPKAAKVRQRKPKGPFSGEQLDQILGQLKGNDAESLLGPYSLVAQLKRQLAERTLSAELGLHLHLHQERELAEPDEPLALTQLLFALLTVTSPQRDLHPQACAYAGRT